MKTLLNIFRRKEISQEGASSPYERQLIRERAQNETMRHHAQHQQSRYSQGSFGRGFGGL